MGLLYLTPLIQPSFAVITPPSFTGLEVWLDTTDNTKITQSSGLISAFVDKTAHAYSFGASGAQRPTLTASGINGLQCITCSTTTWLDATLSANLAPVTVGIVVKPSVVTSDTQAYFASYITNNDLTLCAGASNSIEVFKTSAGHTAVGSTNSFVAGTAYWIMYVYDGAGAGTVTTYVNNVQVGTNGQAFSLLHLNKICGYGGSTGWGSGFAANAILGECCIYGNTMSSSDRTSLYNNYIKPKWGLP